MQTSQSFKKNIWLPPLVIFIFLLFGISSCGDKAPKGSCIALLKSRIDKEWVKPGYIKDIDYLTFITCYNPISHEINVSVQAYKKDYKTIGPLVKLITGDGWTDTLPPVAVGKNNIDLVKLDILNKAGELKDFAYVNLIPFAENGYLWYDNKVVDKHNKSLTNIVLTANPCPPCINCKPPCPTNCTPACSQHELDSIHNIGAIFIDTIKGH